MFSFTPPVRFHTTMSSSNEVSYKFGELRGNFDTLSREIRETEHRLREEIIDDLRTALWSLEQVVVEVLDDCPGKTALSSEQHSTLRQMKEFFETADMKAATGLSITEAHLEKVDSFRNSSLVPLKDRVTSGQSESLNSLSEVNLIKSEHENIRIELERMQDYIKEAERNVECARPCNTWIRALTCNAPGRYGRPSNPSLQLEEAERELFSLKEKERCMQTEMEHISRQITMFQKAHDPHDLQNNTERFESNIDNMSQFLTEIKTAISHVKEKSSILTRDAAELTRGAYTKVDIAVAIMGLCMKALIEEKTKKQIQIIYMLFVEKSRKGGQLFSDERVKSQLETLLARINGFQPVQSVRIWELIIDQLRD